LIPSNAYLLVWADDETAQNGAGNSDLHANFKLSADGELLALFAPDGATLRHAVTFGIQAENVSQGWFPDGNTNEIFSMTNATPRAANTLAEPPPPLRFIDVSIVSGQLALQWQAVPDRIYTLEFKENLSDQAWSVLARDIPATGNTASATDHLNATHRLYRITVQD
jgi:hypothetical protein